MNPLLGYYEDLAQYLLSIQREISVLTSKEEGDLLIKGIQDLYMQVQLQIKEVMLNGN